MASTVSYQSQQFMYMEIPVESKSNLSYKKLQKIVCKNSAIPIII